MKENGFFPYSAIVDSDIFRDKHCPFVCWSASCWIFYWRTVCTDSVDGDWNCWWTVGIHYLIAYVNIFILIFFLRVRGIFGSILTVFQYIGILLAYCVGSYLPYQYVPCIMVVLPVIFFLCMICFVPESPQFLLTQHRETVRVTKRKPNFFFNYQQIN